MSERLVKRIVRFHAVRLYTGHPIPWKSDEIRGLKTSMEDGRMRVSFHAEREPTGPGRRGPNAGEPPRLLRSEGMAGSHVLMGR